MTTSNELEELKAKFAEVCKDAQRWRMVTKQLCLSADEYGDFATDIPVPDDIANSWMTHQVDWINAFTEEIDKLIDKENAK